MEPQVPQVPQTPQGQPVVVQTNPGQGLGIASLVCSLIGMSLVGLILGIIAMKKSKEVGMSNGLALAGVIISSIGMVFGVLWFIFFFIVGIADGVTSSSY